jgi:hypothetical protein
VLSAKKKLLVLHQHSLVCYAIQKTGKCSPPKNSSISTCNKCHPMCTFLNGEFTYGMGPNGPIIPDTKPALASPNPIVSDAPIPIEASNPTHTLGLINLSVGAGAAGAPHLRLAKFRSDKFETPENDFENYPPYSYDSTLHSLKAILSFAMEPSILAEANAMFDNPDSAQWTYTTTLEKKK